MGLGIMSSGDSYRTFSLNPDPYKFRIVKTSKINGLHISMINYPNCTNYEGNKLLVTTYDPRNRLSIDPHFSGDGGLVARFQPTLIGWESAVSFVKGLK